MIDDGIPFRVDWVKLGEAFVRGELDASASRRTVLRIALSLQVFGFAVNLGEALTGLDRATTDAVLRAIAAAAGHPAAAS
ncbi:hypothetical protein [Streptomyces noursei]|uniref:hypothetical protein n=1 Tax=Streptomyces noursei TaxID=1971 RepID=UPI00167ACBA4|nr:hypothetical protein [Streptomyces noursei]MCZ1021383.1 hypothetical protein [Streptomyces noursei]GGX56398.1 hypothetical protein GCM10010341_91180 [Streptomyces noursei]